MIMAASESNQHADGTAKDDDGTILWRKEDNNNEQKVNTQENSSKPGEHSSKNEDNDDSAKEDLRTKEQEEADMLFEQMRQELESDSPDMEEREDPPEYDVKDRLKQLNADLANDPDPATTDRKVRVGFKEDLVSVVPPEDYSSDEEGESEQEKAGVVDKNKTDKKTEDQEDNSGQFPNKKHDETDKTDTSNGANETSELPPKAKDNDDKDENSDHNNSEKVLIERDGKFDLVSVEELKAQGLDPSLYGLVLEDENTDKKPINETESSQNTETTHQASGDSNESDKSANLQPTPPDRPRPSTANDGVKSRQVKKPGERRVQSARSNKLNWNFNYKSPYGLTDAQLEIKKQRDEIIAKRKQEDIKKKKEEEIQKKIDGEEMFQGWLENKKKQIAMEKKAEEEKKNKNEEEEKKMQVGAGDTAAAKEAYEGWLANKSKIIKHERLLEKREQREREEGFFERSREECQNAFKLWLRKKNSDIHKSKASYRQRSRAHSQSAKLSRKSQQLAKDIRQAESYRYVDYYGYRA